MLSSMPAAHRGVVLMHRPPARDSSAIEFLIFIFSSLSFVTRAWSTLVNAGSARNGVLPYVAPAKAAARLDLLRRRNESATGTAPTHCVRESGGPALRLGRTARHSTYKN